MKIVIVSRFRSEASMQVYITEINKMNRKYFIDHSDLAVATHSTTEMIGINYNYQSERNYIAKKTTLNGQCIKLLELI